MAYPTSIATDSDLYLTKNQLAGVLDGGLDASQTTVTLASTTGFPAVGVVTVDSEVIKYTSTSGTQLLGCTRGFDGTSATTHSSGAVVKHASTAIHHNALKDELIAVETALGTNFVQRVFQITQGTSTTEFTTTNTAFQTTNLSATITPASSTHRIKITVTGSLKTANPQDANVYFTVARGASNLGTAQGFGALIGGSATGSFVVPAALVYIDSPATTSATTYNVQIRSDVSGKTVSFGNQGTQVIVLEEIL